MRSPENYFRLPLYSACPYVRVPPRAGFGVLAQQVTSGFARRSAHLSGGLTVLKVTYLSTFQTFPPFHLSNLSTPQLLPHNLQPRTSFIFDELRERNIPDIGRLGIDDILHGVKRNVVNESGGGIDDH